MKLLLDSTQGTFLAVLEFHDLVGGFGAAVLLLTYFLLQINRISAKSMMYSQLNALGSALILTSLYFDFNLSAFMIESFWFVISCVGAAVTWRQTRRMRRRDRSKAS
ncbi:MAG: hypothetical protein NXI32_10355 [bacterium]|nr:hypothetical protein [bacterium]